MVYLCFLGPLCICRFLHACAKDVFEVTCAAWLRGGLETSHPSFYLRIQVVLAKYLNHLTKRRTRLSDLMDGIQFVTPKTAKAKELRASAFPVCSLLFLEQYLKPRTKYQNMHHSEYHTAVGHMLHSYVQDGVSKVSQEIYGQWKCKRCKDLVTEVSPRPTACRKCGAPSAELEYEEISLSRSQFGVELTAHMDGLMLTANSTDLLPAEFGPDCPEDVHVTILDYKTFSLMDASRLPVPKHLLQLAVYLVLLENAFYVPVNSLSILYVPKDKPSKHIEFSIQVTDDLVDTATLMIERSMAGYAAYTELVELDKQVQQTGEYSQQNLVSANAILDKVYDCRLCSPPADHSQSSFYEENIRQFFFDSQEDLKTGEVKYLTRCHLDGICPSKTGWKNTVLSDLQSMDRTPMDDRVIRWSKTSSLLKRNK